MLLVFTATIFLSAFLLFLVQPMVAKMVLPVLGGSPAVWNTSMVFFQAVLLAGYLYAHVVTRRLTPARQVLVHAFVLVLPLVAVTAIGRLPVLDPRTLPPPGATYPAIWLLGALALAVGGPFFVLSTTGPLMQRWFAATTHRHARDPYFLYAASNIGSMLALLGYPLAMERVLRLQEQRAWFSAGYAAFGALALGCGVLMLRNRPTEPVSRQDRRRMRLQEEASGPGSAAQPAAPPLSASVTGLTRLRWVALAAVPSSLMLGVTQHISSDIASVPLLWVIPLALYLVTFILAFGSREIPIRKLSVLFLALASALALMTLARTGKPAAAVIGAHMLTFFLGSLICHARLARERPDPSRLTEYYLLIAVGGVVGGSFNALLAPVIFNAIAEYPIAIVAACLLTAPSFADEGPGEPPPALPLETSLRELAWFTLGALGWAVVFAWAYLGVENQLPAWIPVAPRNEFEFWIAFSFITAPLVGYGIWRARGRPSALDVLAPGATLLAYLGLQYAFHRGIPIQQWTLLGGWPAVVTILIAVSLLTIRLLIPTGRLPSLAADLLVPAIIGFSDIAVHRIVHDAGMIGGNIRFIVWYGLTGLLLLLSIGRRLRTTLAVAVVMALYYFYAGAVDTQLLTTRTFFGVHRVAEDAGGNWRLLSHGTTRHGMQATDPARAMTPTMYYHPTGPIGEIFNARKDDPEFDQVAIIGLGTGGLAAYAQEHQTFTYYEIDPKVVWIARGSGYFTFLERTKARKPVPIKVGDGRLEIAKAPPKAYDLIIIDAFSSDSIPIHLITREAVALYFEKLAEGGIVAFHISNRYLELRPPLGAIAADAGYAARWSDDAQRISDAERAAGKLTTTWVAFARRPEDFRGLNGHEHWPVLGNDPRWPRWTDDYSNIMPILILR